MLTVNGLQLPASFVEFIKEHRYTDWDLKERVDAYGNPLDTDFEPFDTVERMEQNTAEVAEGFGVGRLFPEEVRGLTDEARTSPGFIPYIADFSKIACYGRSVGGAPFCFDFRENLEEPSVIYHDDRYACWRRVAPNFDTFISLFERWQEEDEEEEVDP